MKPKHFKKFSYAVVISDEVEDFYKTLKDARNGQSEAMEAYSLPAKYVGIWKVSLLTNEYVS